MQLNEEKLKPILEKLNFVLLGTDFARITLKFCLYDLESVYSAAYNMFDNASFFFDGNSEEVQVYIFAKQPNTLTSLVLEFNNHLINYSYYKIRSSENKTVREFIISKSLFGIPGVTDSEESCACESTTTNESEPVSDPLFSEPESDDFNLDDYEVEDIESIRTPWEEKNDANVMSEEKKKLGVIFSDSDNDSGISSLPNNKNSSPSVDSSADVSDDSVEDISIPWLEEDVTLSDEELDELKKKCDALDGDSE